MKSIIRLLTALPLPLADLQAAKPLNIQPRSVKGTFLSLLIPAWKMSLQPDVRRRA
jgi:hypothetical protein